MTGISEVKKLKESLGTREFGDRLWECVVAWEGHTFRTSGRGRMHTGAVDFSYRIKISSRTGEPTEELIISTRPDSKTITRSSIEMGLLQCLDEQESAGYVRGPKRMSVRGASYLYAMFLEWGIITDKNNTEKEGSNEKS